MESAVDTQAVEVYSDKNIVLKAAVNSVSVDVRGMEGSPMTVIGNNPETDGITTEDLIQMETANVSHHQTTVAEDGVNSAEEVKYFMAEGLSKRHHVRLLDSRGYSYTKHTENKNGSIMWRCSVRNSRMICGAKVKQMGDMFSLVGKDHCHTAVQDNKHDVEQHKGDGIPLSVPVSSVLTEEHSTNLQRLFKPTGQTPDAGARDQPGPECDTTHSAALEELHERDSDTEEGVSVSAPKIGAKFSSFEEVEEFIRTYEDANFVKYFRMNSCSVESSRRRLPKRYVSDHLRYATVVFACIHHGKPKTTSKGFRPRQKTLRMGCPAKFRFSVTPDGKQLYLGCAVTKHSHPHTEETFRSLPQRRQLTEVEREEACIIMQKKGKKMAQKHLQETMGKVVTMRDLHNLVALSRQQSACYTNIQAILTYLSETEDESSIVEVVTKADGKIVGIYYQDQEMKRVYSDYPQYLAVDSACKYNNLRMPLYVMLVEDSNRDYEIGAIFLVLSSNMESIRSMLHRFKEHNPNWDKIQVIMADKNFSERMILRDEFPNASVEICFSFVLRSFKQDILKKHLNLEKEETSFCLELLRKLATSKSEAIYMENYQQLLNSRLEPLIGYYNSTWHSSRHEWVEGLKSKSLILKNETRDQFESISQLLTDVFKNLTSPGQVIANLKKVVEVLREERDHAAAALLAEESSEDIQANETTKNFQEYVTPFALKHILRQLKLSWKVKVKAGFNNKTSCVKTNRGKLTVNVDSCPCRFWHSLQLPCRHIFAVRRTKGLPFFSKDIISHRWSIEHYKLSCRLFGQNSDLSCTETLKKQRLALLSQQEKHTHISEIAEQLSAAVAEAPDEMFIGHVESVEKLLSAIKSGSAVTVTPTEVGGVHVDSRVEDQSKTTTGEADERETQLIMNAIEMQNTPEDVTNGHCEQMY